jgi:hypothetical protein
MAESTKFRTEQRDAVRIGRIGSFIELLAHDRQSGVGASFIWGLIGSDSD